MSLKVVAEDMKTNACSVVVDNVRDPEVEAGRFNEEAGILGAIPLTDFLLSKSESILVLALELELTFHQIHDPTNELRPN